MNSKQWFTLGGWLLFGGLVFLLLSVQWGTTYNLSSDANALLFTQMKSNIAGIFLILGMACISLGGLEDKR